jgi:phytoene dehydrogenase-like protein
VTKAIGIGGGIGGLTATAAGVEVAVFERAPELRYEKIAKYRT